MKTLTTFILAGALALLAQPNQLDLRQDPPVAVQSERVSSAYTGTSGATTYYYWVVTRYPIGFIVPTAPVIVGGASALGGGNSVALGWPAMTGASSYDVLRTTTNAAPSSCTCAVVLATTGTTLTDNGGALSAWPPANLRSAGEAKMAMQINNRDATAPYAYIQINSTIIPFLPNIGTHDVRLYGASGDGVTDDYAAFRAACAAAGDGDTVLIPPGVYKLDLTGATPANPKNACLVTANNVTVMGSGKASHLNMVGWTVADGMANPDGGLGLQVATAIAFGDSTHTVTGGMVRDVYITGTWNGVDLFSGTTYSRAKGVGLYNANGVTVTGIETALIPGNGVNWSGNIGSVYDVSVKNSKIDQSAEGGVNFMGGTHRGSITNSYISRNGGTGIEAACTDCSFSENWIWLNLGGIYASGGRASINNNNVWLSDVHGIYIDPQVSACDDAMLSGNISRENGQAGIAVGAACKRASISGGSVQGNGVYGVALFNGNDGSSIIGADASDYQGVPTQQNGITVIASSNVIIQGCRLFGNVAQSIYYGSGATPIITGNVADRAIVVDGSVTGEVVANNIP